MSTFNNNFSLLRTIKEVDNALVSTVEQIKLNKDGLALEILNRINDKELLRNELSSELHNTNFELVSELRNTNFELVNTISENNIRNAVDNERHERNAAINKEILDRDAAINKEKNYLQLEINKLGFQDNFQLRELRKLGFMSTCEAEGILSANSYPFSYGMGSRSGPQFGLPVPFEYAIRRIGFSCESTDASPSIVISIYHYPFDTSDFPHLQMDMEFPHLQMDMEQDGFLILEKLIISGKSFQTTLNDVSGFGGSSGGFTGGNLIIKVISTSGITDVNTKMRITLILTSSLELFPGPDG